MDRVILHSDMNNFYASVECLRMPHLRDLPMAVAGSPKERHGIILAKNEHAKKFGIKTGDVIWEARQKCPDIVFVPPHYDEYMDFSQRAFKIYTRFTGQVEPFGADECWLDCTNSLMLFESGLKIAESIRAVIKNELGLTASVGVSFNKVFAKLGSDLKKPDATTVIDRANFKKIIFPLNASEMLGIGRKTAEKLAKLNIKTIGDLALSDRNLLISHFGIVGARMLENANGLDQDPVRESSIAREIKSVGHGMTASKDVKTMVEAATLIAYLADLVGARMRKYGVKGGGVAISIRYADLSHTAKQCTLPQPIFTAKEITAAALNLLKIIWNLKPLRSIAVSVFGLVKESAGQQLSLFDIHHEKAEKLEKAVDKIRLKHGKDKIFLASMLKTDYIYDKTEAEDFLPFYRG